MNARPLTEEEQSRLGVSWWDLAWLPDWGKVIHDDAIGYVLIFRDFSGIVHYTLIDDPQFAAEVNEPKYGTEDESFIHQMIVRTNEVVEGAEGAFGKGLNLTLSPSLWFGVGALALVYLAKSGALK